MVDRECDGTLAGVALDAGGRDGGGATTQGAVLKSGFIAALFGAGQD